MLRYLLALFFSLNVLQAAAYYKDFAQEHLFTDILNTTQNLPQYGVKSFAYRFNYHESVVVPALNNVAYNGNEVYFPQAWTGAKIYFPKGLTKATFAMITKPNSNMMVHVTFVGDDQTSDGVINHYTAHTNASNATIGTYEKPYANGTTVTLDPAYIDAHGGGWVYIDLMKNENSPNIAHSINPAGVARVDITQNIGFTAATFDKINTWVANTNFINNKQSPITPYRRLAIINDRSANNVASSVEYTTLPTGTQRYLNIDDAYQQLNSGNFTPTVIECSDDTTKYTSLHNNTQLKNLSLQNPQNNSAITESFSTFNICNDTTQASHKRRVFVPGGVASASLKINSSPSATYKLSATIIGNSNATVSTITPVVINSSATTIPLPAATINQYKGAWVYLDIQKNAASDDNSRLTLSLNYTLSSKTLLEDSISHTTYLSSCGDPEQRENITIQSINYTNTAGTFSNETLNACGPQGAGDYKTSSTCIAAGYYWHNAGNSFAMASCHSENYFPPAPPASTGGGSTSSTNYVPTIDPCSVADKPASCYVNQSSCETANYTWVVSGFGDACRNLTNNTPSSSSSVQSSSASSSSEPPITCAQGEEYFAYFEACYPFNSDLVYNGSGYSYLTDLGATQSDIKEAFTLYDNQGFDAVLNMLASKGYNSNKIESLFMQYFNGSTDNSNSSSKGEDNSPFINEFFIENSSDENLYNKIAPEGSYLLSGKIYESSGYFYYQNRNENNVYYELDTSKSTLHQIKRSSIPNNSVLKGYVFAVSSTWYLVSSQYTDRVFELSYNNAALQAKSIGNIQVEILRNAIVHLKKK